MIDFPIEDDTPACDYDCWPDHHTDVYTFVFVPPSVGKSAPMPAPAARPVTAHHGQRGKLASNMTVTINGETRGPDWGEGRAAEEFARWREYFARIPKGHYVEQDLREMGIIK